MSVTIVDECYYWRMLFSLVSVIIDGECVSIGEFHLI